MMPFMAHLTGPEENNTQGLDLNQSGSLVIKRNHNFQQKSYLSRSSQGEGEGEKHQPGHPKSKE